MMTLVEWWKQDGKSTEEPGSAVITCCVTLLSISFWVGPGVIVEVDGRAEVEHEVTADFRDGRNTSSRFGRYQKAEAPCRVAYDE